MNIFRNRRKLAKYDRVRREIIERRRMTEGFETSPQATEFDKGVAYAYKRAVELLARELSS